MFEKYKNLISKYFKYNQAFWQQELDQSKLYGRPHPAIGQIYENVHANASPTFVLSTGRCGTKLLTDLIQSSSDASVAHQPSPELMHSSWYAYQNFGHKFYELCQIIDACRYEMIRDAWLLNRLYIETNNRITFFAPYLAKLFPRSKFVHLKREPISFITSGYSRNWYSYEKLVDEGRITPRPQAHVPWDGYSQVQKIAWLWQETNQFIDDFLSTVPSERTFYLDSNDLYHDPGKVIELLSFIGIDSIGEDIVKKRIARPVNAQPNAKRKKLDPGQIDEINQILKNQ